MKGGMSAIGTKQTSPGALHMSAFDPKRTCPFEKLRPILQRFPKSILSPAGRWSLIGGA
jgi:hypothetical protein